MSDHAHINGELVIPFDEATTEDLIKNLPIFFQRALKVNGKVYLSNSLMAMFHGLAWNLAVRKCPINLKTSKTFEPGRSVFKKNVYKWC